MTQADHHWTETGAVTDSLTVKLYVLSDLHLEFSGFLPDPVALEQCDVVVLAGDIGKGAHGIEWARRTFGCKPVVYVCGNHEFYGHDWDELLEEMRQHCTRWDVNFLENDQAVIGGVRFLGASMWTDFALLGHETSALGMVAAERGLNDFRQIRVRAEGGRLLRPMDCVRRHQESREWLGDQLAQGFVGPTVVVTHHAPSGLSVPARYSTKPLTAGFAANLEGLASRSNLWIHGHFHDSTDYRVPGSSATSGRVVCNPRGYRTARSRETVGRTDSLSFENSNFDPGKLILI